MVKKLGRGLDALIRKSENPDSGSASLEIRHVDPHHITVNRAQPRVHFDDSALRELAASIRKEGILQPLVVRRQETGGYELIAGERRLRASLSLDLATVPVIVRDDATESLLELALIENIQREDLNPIELARAYQALREQHQWTQNELAEHLGKKRSSIANAMRFLELPDRIQNALALGEITQGHAKVLLGLDEATQSEAFEALLVDDLSVRELEDRVRPRADDVDANGDPSGSSSTPSTSGGGPGAGGIAVPRSARPGKAKSPQLAEEERVLSESLGTKVEIKSNGQRGRIAIEFYSPEDYERLKAILTRSPRTGG